MLKILKDRKGFTLIELMVVVAILAVLASMVAGGVTGAGTSGEKSQVASDASSVKTAVTSYQNAAINQSYPVASVTLSGSDYVFPAGMFTVIDGTPVAKTIQGAKLANISYATVSSGVTNYQAIIWATETYVRQKQGGTALAKMVPDFLDAPPDSTRLLSSVVSASGGTDMLPEYLWLLKIGSPLDANARSVQVWHLAEDTHPVTADRGKYIRIYPKVQ